jgi:hypothetical protein
MASVLRLRCISIRAEEIGPTKRTVKVRVLRTRTIGYHTRDHQPQHVWTGTCFGLSRYFRSRFVIDNRSVLYGTVCTTHTPSRLDATPFLTSSGRTPNNGQNHSLVQQNVNSPVQNVHRGTYRVQNVLGGTRRREYRAYAKTIIRAV